MRSWLKIPSSGETFSGKGDVVCAPGGIRTPNLLIRTRRASVSLCGMVSHVRRRVCRCWAGYVEIGTYCCQLLLSSWLPDRLDRNHFGSGSGDPHGPFEYATGRP